MGDMNAEYIRRTRTRGECQNTAATKQVLKMKKDMVCVCVYIHIYIYIHTYIGPNKQIKLCKLYMHDRLMKVCVRCMFSAAFKYCEKGDKCVSLN